ncbi:hypothetical protein CONPUDRAFT_150632 [Coniophora puteana RWD-64-598 SS2]|uniref:Acid protease n=1 Tax=Coniophora puteana (strain RWD-64-598) TaxID=741705 RepID=A0A5M3N3H7_CONPW|nr:uncharacterized protein CONPUDRAFT_150632 [Coniophora puteana RWD-64-598 SS2]EIW85857.1 hypothetical protein CONPUDRAFT_150632 [Coniophora puteana RWD-64-598 SS2]
MLLIDTGSSNTWVGTDQLYTPTSTSTDTGNTVQVSYGSGLFSGEDPSASLPPPRASPVSTGILGVSPTDLTSGTVSNTDTVPTVTDNLYSAGTISTEVLGIYYAPAAGSDSTGEPSFSSVESGHEQDDGQSTAQRRSWTQLLVSLTPALRHYTDPHRFRCLLEIPYSSLSDLNFKIGGTTYALNANAQIWPRVRARERTAWRATHCHVPRGAGALLARGFSGVWHGAGDAAAAAACGKERVAVVWGGGVEEYRCWCWYKWWWWWASIEPGHVAR